jgi:hypothetical protein
MTDYTQLHEPQCLYKHWQKSVEHKTEEARNEIDMFLVAENISSLFN